MYQSTFHITFLFGMLLSAAGWAQLDTTVQLSTVEIAAAKLRQLPVGSPNQTWTSTQLGKITATNIASLLGEESGTFIKNYGNGTLATSSIRGGNGGHTLVLWNGLPIQSPMLGLLDLSLLPVEGVETVSIQKGGNTALWGSGAIGGLVRLQNESDFSNQLSIENQTVLGSFGYWQQVGILKIGTQKFQSSTRFSYEKGDNNFNYEIAPTLPKRQQTNANFKQRNIQQDFYWKINAQNQLDIHAWRQDIHRAIPPTNVQTRSVAYQEDWSNRVIANWKHIGQLAIWNIKTGFFDEYQDFVNDLIRLKAHNHFQSTFGEITRQWTWRQQHQLLVGGTHTYTKAWSKNYTGNIIENKSALFASWKWQQADWAIQSSLRQELVDGDLAPLVPVVGVQYRVTPFLNIQFKVSKNYRLPTLNDRYWKPGGNASLQPESGWSEEATISSQTRKGNWHWEGSITGFNRLINNWILWTLPQGQNFWSAHNLTEVWSRGVEPRFSFSFKNRDLVVTMKGGYDYIRSTNQVALESPKIEQGDQLIYTPIHQGFGKISAEWKGWYASYHHQFTGQTQGINEPIPAYQVGTMRFQYATALQQYQGKLFLNIHNVWDTNYVVVERRPMAGRHYQIGINLFFQRRDTKIQR